MVSYTYLYRPIQRRALVNLLKEAGVWRHIEQIQFVTDDEEEEVTNEGHFKETVG